jgi:hypothetical protein
MKSTDFVVARNDLQQCKLVETELPDADALPPESLLVKVDRFAFTANNITYAVLGDELKYWQLFPAPNGFGNIPVWGFGEVIVSRHPNVAVGERLFGYFPMATHLAADEPELPGAEPRWFFAPDQIRRRAREWGPGGIEQRFSAAWSDFVPLLERCLALVESRGAEAVREVYLDTLNGRIPPEQGHMLSLAG